MPICGLLPRPILIVQSNPTLIPLLVVECDLLVNVSEAHIETEEGGLGRHEVAFGAVSALFLESFAAVLTLSVEQSRDCISLARSDDGVAPDCLEEL